MTTQVEVTIAGIPATVRVTRFKHVRGQGPSAPSDVDCHGYTEMEYQVCDRAGKDAHWLARKVQPADIERIEAAIHEHYAEA